MVDADGTTLIGEMALPEVQAYRYRAARTIADIEQHLGLGDGAAALAEAERLARDVSASFLFDSAGGPFVGLALDGDKRLLAVRASNAGHVLWSGVLAPEVAMPVARQLADPDLFSGWGVRTLSNAAAGYNPFGYHRGGVWPHDTGFALHGAARYGVGDVVRRFADGLVALGTAARRCSSPSSSADSIAPTCRCRCPTRLPAGRRPGRRAPRWPSCERCWASSRTFPTGSSGSTRCSTQVTPSRSAGCAAERTRSP